MSTADTAPAPGLEAQWAAWHAWRAEHANDSAYLLTCQRLARLLGGVA